MRSYNNLYEPMLQDDYIKQRFINASKKKKNRNDVREVLENLDEHTELLKKMLTEELFIPDYHKPSIINESSSKKTRRILKPHYKYEQVIHHCAIGQFKPIVMNGLYAKVRKMIASMAKAAAVNNKIGYDQSERYTFWEHLKASNYDPAQITIACEADCSSGVAAIVKGAGYRLGNEKMKNVSIYLYTGNMRAGLKAAGFEVLTDSKYLTSDAYLLEGDILLNDNAHVATNLTDGAKSSGTGASNTTTVKSNAKVDVAHGFNKSLAGTYKVTASGLNLRAGAGTGKSILAVMKNGEKVQCYGYYNDCNGVKWLYVVYKNIVGYASSKYLSK